MSKLRSKCYESLMMCCETTACKEDITAYLLHLEKIKEAVLKKDFKRAEELANETH